MKTPKKKRNVTQMETFKKPSWVGYPARIEKQIKNGNLCKPSWEHQRALTQPMSKDIRKQKRSKSPLPFLSGKVEKGMLQAPSVSVHSNFRSSLGTGERTGRDLIVHVIGDILIHRRREQFISGSNVIYDHQYKTHPHAGATREQHILKRCYV